MRGFSLLEILVAIALFIFMTVILVSIAGSLSGLWQRGIAHNDRRSAAMSVFNRMTRDLHHATLPTDPGAGHLQFVINPSGVSSAYRLPQAAFWQAPVAADRSHGDMAVVGYFVQWVNDPQGPVPKLCRVLVDSTNYRSSKPSTWINDALIASNAPASRSSNYLGQLAENVLGIWMRPLDQNRQPIAMSGGSYDSTAGYSVTLTNNAGLSSSHVFSNSLPASLEVAIVTVDGRTARKLTGTEKPGAATANIWNDVSTFLSNLPPMIQQGAQVHSTTIDLVSAPR